MYSFEAAAPGFKMICSQPSVGVGGLYDTGEPTQEALRVAGTIDSGAARPHARVRLKQVLHFFT